VRAAAIFFDLDDTLLDDAGAKRAYLPKLFVQWRDRLPHCDEMAFEDAWRTAVEYHFERHLRGELTLIEQRRERMREVFQARLSDEACDELIREFLRVYEANWRLFDDVIPVLDALAPVPMGVITNGFDRQQRQKLLTVRIHDRFKVIVTSDAVKLSKPHPGIFRHAAAAIGARPEHCVHVGDDWKRDVEGAIAAGFRPIWLERGPRGPWSQTPGSVTRIESLKDLVGHI
jgi:putative hydrolase of the HAD superfamily